jgi:hypothetical protein
MPASGYIFGTVPTPPTLPSQRLGGGSGSVSGTGRGVSVPAHIYKAVAEASQKVGVSFAYLMTKASTESSFNPNAQAKTSSASGLYQFIERTWLDMVDKHGAQYGLGTYADAITRRADGTPVVANRTLRKEILDLRKDPRVSALMAAEYAGENKRYLESKLGRPITDTDLYLAHFLGAGGATRFLSAMESNPSTRAAAVMPAAASANRGVFYASSTGRALSLQAVYDRFERKFDTAPLYVADGATPIAEPGLMDASWRSDASRPASDGAIPNMYLISALETPVENDESEPSHAISALHATGRYLAAPGAVPYAGSLYRGLA